MRQSIISQHEGQLLIACARYALDIAGSGPDASLSDALRPWLEPPLRWDLVLQMAQQQGVVPALHRCLQQNPAVPQAVRDRLHLLFRVNAARNQYLLETLETLLTTFASDGLPAIPYKGPALAASLYGDLGRRACGDLDLLVRPTDVLRARDLLRGSGFTPVHQFRDRKEEQEHLRDDCEYNLKRADDGVYVELHWAFRPQFFPLPLDMDGLWARARTVRVGGMTMPTLAPEDLLLVLCVHGAKHCWERLGWICDVAALLRAHPDLDGHALAAQANALRCARVLWLGLTLAQDLLGVTPPEPFGVRPPAVVAALAAWVRRLLSGGPDRPVAQRLLHLRILFHLRVRDRLQDRLPLARHWAGLLFQKTKEAWGS